jgi:pectate lyase
VSRGILLALIATLAATAVACGDAKLYPYVKPTIEPIPCEDTALYGWAAVGGGADGGAAQTTTGGGNSQPVVVRDVDRLTAELQRLEPGVIYLEGMLTTTATIKVTLDKDLRGGNKTLIGMGDNSGLTGAGLDLSYADNVILRNLKISKVSVGEGDAITILASHYIWIDHCDLSSDRDDTISGYDGLVDITHGSSNITISWTRFHDHKDATLVGHSSDVTQMEEDAALSVTYHHNLFLNVNSGPRVRWGTAHVFNNYFQTVTSFGVVSESAAKVQVDHNVFADDVGLAIATTYQDPTSGTMTEMTNEFPAGFVPDIIRAAPPISLPYSPMPDSVNSLAFLVSECAGTGKVNLTP